LAFELLSKEGFKNLTMARSKATAKQRREKKRNARQKSQTANQQDDAINPQLQSRLLRLPRELRDEIYRYVFASTRISSGERHVKDRLRNTIIKSSPTALAILRTCRLIGLEAGYLWLSHVTFSFERPEDLLDKISGIPTHTLSQIRHIRVGGGWLELQSLEDDCDTLYSLAMALKLLPALNLDTLTVIGHQNGPDAYSTVDGLIQEGNGWKELRFIAPNSNMLDFWMWGDYHKPQPGAWNSILEARDGAESGASVTVYRSKEPKARPGSVCKPAMRMLCEQSVSASEELAEFGAVVDESLWTPEQRGKELLVIAKRGHNANIMEPDQPPYECAGDIRHWAGKMSWPKIKHECSLELLTDDILGNDGEGEGEGEGE
jgi:hypothetical protein